MHILIPHSVMLCAGFDYIDSDSVYPRIIAIYCVMVPIIAIYCVMVNYGALLPFGKKQKKTFHVLSFGVCFISVGACVAQLRRFCCLHSFGHYFRLRARARVSHFLTGKGNSRPNTQNI